MTSVLLRLEGLALLGAAVAAFVHLEGSWLLFIALLLVPDVALLGYLKGPKPGSRVYNLGHTLALPVPLLAIGLMMGWPVLLSVALVWTAHIGMDRAVGFGLKDAESFRRTHLQKV